MRILTILVLFLSINSYSQSMYRFVGKGCKNLKICREITVKPTHVELAKRVAGRYGTIEQIHINTTRAVINATMRPSLRRPASLVGTNNFLRKIEKVFKKRPGWERISRRGGYNGAHHIVTKNVIRNIARNRSEIAANAPSVFHPLHDNPIYISLFHDLDRQLALYEKGGIKEIVTDFFLRINEVNKEFDLPEYTQEQIEQTLLEAELWAKHWGIRWE